MSRDDLVKAVMEAIVSCRHDIDSERVILWEGPRQEGINAYAQLAARVQKSIDSQLSAKDAEIAVLRKALTGLRSYFLTHGWDEKSMMVENIDQALNGGGNGRS